MTDRWRSSRHRLPFGMRLWSLHPQYLDPRGLVALWREALLARAVLQGETRGYHHHPQLQRFRSHEHPKLAISSYLASVHSEAERRGYSFDRSKIGPICEVDRIVVTRGQLDYEWEHLMKKLASRNPALHQKWCSEDRIVPHQLFVVRAGPVAPWERTEAEGGE